jgi:hypothetical protein
MELKITIACHWMHVALNIATIISGGHNNKVDDHKIKVLFGAIPTYSFNPSSYSFSLL